MRCPKCQFDHPLQTTECLKCGIVFSKYQPPPGALAQQPRVAASAAAPTVSPTAKQADPAALVSSLAASLDTALSADPDKSPADVRKAAATEFKYRLLALPLALLVARWLTGTGFNLVAGMLEMVTHECGHAATAWLVGRWAIPTFWVTMIGQERHWPIVAIVTAAILSWGFLACRAQRWGWVCAAAVVLVLQIAIQSLSPFKQAALITFGGEGGAMVWSTILMATFYASRESKLYKSWGVRWGLLFIGALAFMHVYRSWSGSWGNIPFGEIEGVNLSDPSLLTTLYGWSVTQMVDRYLELAKFCFAVMAAMYAWGLASAYVDMRYPASPQPEDTYKRFEISASR